MFISGKIDGQIALYAIIAFSLACAFTDILRGRIYNWMTAPMLVAGVVFSVFYGGWQGVGASLVGIVAGLVLYGWMFLMKAMGGGDVKMLMALGAWGGLHYVSEVAVLGVLLGGAMAAIVLLLKGRLFGFVRKMARFLMTVFVRELELETPKIDQKLTMPYGVPIAAAAIWVILAHPLDQFGGVGLWK